MRHSGPETGRTLAEVVKGGISPADAVRLAPAVADAVAVWHARSGPHGGLAPGVIEVVDGGARVRGPDLGNQPGRAYRPPEWFLDRQEPPRVTGDLYALGVILFELLAGRPPFGADDALGWRQADPVAPPPLSSVRPEVPAGLTAVVGRLLARRPADRYERAADVVADLARCCGPPGTSRPEGAGPDGRPSPSAGSSLSGRVFPSTRVHGRTAERDRLRSALAAAESRASLLVTVSGPAGIGKTALATDFLGEIRDRGGLAATGKFDLSYGSVPYATVPRMVGALVEQVLAGEVDDDLVRRRVLEALGPSAGPATQAAPALERLIGPQPQVPPARGEDVTARFLETMRRLVTALAGDVPVLALCFDDLQWADAPSIELIRNLAGEPGIGGLVLVVSHRPEPAADEAADQIARSALGNAKTVRLRLGPLDESGIGELVTDALGGPAARIEVPGTADEHLQETGTGRLARVVCARSAGNPFEAIRVLWELRADGSIRYDTARQGWSLDLRRFAYEDAPRDADRLAAAQLRRLPALTRRLLAVASCLRGEAPLPVLAEAVGVTGQAARSSLAAAVEANLVAVGGLTPEGGLTPGDDLTAEGGAEVGPETDAEVVRFAHDRVRQAARLLLPPGRQAAVRLALARALRAHTEPDERIYDVAEQYTTAAYMPRDPSLRRDLVGVFLRTGLRAQTAGAFAAAGEYLDEAVRRLRKVDWRDARELAVQVHRARAEVAFAEKDLPLAGRLIDQAYRHSRSPAERAAAFPLLIDLLFIRGRVAELTDWGLREAARLGMSIPANPGKEAAAKAFWPAYDRLTAMTYEQLVALPRCRDERAGAAMGTLQAFASWAVLFDPNVAIIAAVAVIDLTLRHGLTPESPSALGFLALLACGRYGRYAQAQRFARAAFDLACDPLLSADRPLIQMELALVMRWCEPPEVVIPYFVGATDGARLAGRPDVVCYALCWQHAELLWTDQPLDEAADSVEGTARYIDGLGYPAQREFMNSVRWFTARLRGQWRPGPDGTDPEADGIAERLRPLPFIAHFHEATRAQLLALEGEHEQVLAATERAERLGQEATGILETADIWFYRGLAAAALADTAPPADRSRLLEQVEAALTRLRDWAVSGPARFGCRSTLLAAERARLAGDEGAASRGFDSALRMAREARQVGAEALAAQTAARWYAATDRPTVAATYRHLARGAYARWGAAARVAALDAESAAEAAAGVPDVRGDTGDALAITRSCQSLAGIVEFDDLVHDLMRIITQESGADYAALLMTAGDRLELTADAHVPRRDTEIQVRTYPPGTAAQAASLPTGVLSEVSVRQAPVQLDDAAAAEAVRGEPDLIRPTPKTLLCLPMLHGQNLRGLLYLENGLFPYAFPSGRRGVLELLATQAAISVENATARRELRGVNERLERQVAERTEQLQTTIQELEAFSYSVSHDLRAPLRAVRAFTSLVMEGHAAQLDPEVLLLLQKVIRNAEHMDELIENLLAFSRAGRRTPARESVDMNGLVALAMEELRAGLPGQDVKVVVGELPAATGDAALLRQVWTNLLSNAVKFTTGRDGGRVDVYADTDADGTVTYRVRDNGVGFDPRYADRLFTAFQRLHSARYPGTGIGLAIADRIITGHGGRIWADGEEGRGATFSFTLTSPPGLSR